MAQQDAMEQVKEVVRQIIKYRFWISIGVAALFGLIAYFMGSGPVQRTGRRRRPTKSRRPRTRSRQYTSPTIPTKEYEPIVVRRRPRS